MIDLVQVWATEWRQCREAVPYRCDSASATVAHGMRRLANARAELMLFVLPAPSQDYTYIPVPVSVAHSLHVCWAERISTEFVKHVGSVGGWKWSSPSLGC